MEVGSSGELTISNEGWIKAQEQQMDKLSALTNSKLALMQEADQL
jgi:hypothetical protein